jgi:hypothetical protein
MKPLQTIIKQQGVKMIFKPKPYTEKCEKCGGVKIIQETPSGCTTKQEHKKYCPVLIELQNRYR